jgi:exopolyphosphatase/guanosine-5'-triphosphate,3'-diphosphate pyrophosphatase
LSDLTVEERMLRYKLKRDRADVIVPALLIYTHLMKWGGIEEIYVPKIGLADGLIHHLREQLLETAKR